MLFEFLNASLMCLLAGDYAVLTDKAQETSGINTKEEVEIVNRIRDENDNTIFYSQSECREIKSPI